MSIGPMPEPIMLLSVGRKRSPSTPVGSRLRKTMRTGLSFVAPMNGPRYCGESRHVYPGEGTFVPSRSSLTSGTLADRPVARRLELHVAAHESAVGRSAENFVRYCTSPMTYSSALTPS